VLFTRRYDGQAPAVYIYSGKKNEDKEFRNSGMRMSGRIDREYKGEDFTARLPPGVSWDSVSAVAVWCEQFNALFGSVELKAAEKTDASTKSCSVTTASGTAAAK
jgi:hypothetical protein